MKAIDCLLIGHNQITGTKCERTSRAMWSKSSQFYKEAVTLRFIKYQNRLYTPSQISKLFAGNGRDIGINYEGLSYEDTLNNAIAYLGTYLTRQGLTIDYINCCKSEQEQLVYKLTQSNIHTVAISSSIYTTIFPLLEIVSLIKKHNPSVKIIVGGAYISNQVRSLEEVELQALFKAIGGDVFVYCNEGEQTLYEVVQAIKTNQPLESIHNIFYRNGQTYAFTFPEEYKYDIESNRVNWSLFGNRLGKYINVRTAISCPFACAFCGYPKYAGKYQQISIESLEHELDQLAETGQVEGLYFIDDTFNFPVDRFKRILKMMIKKQYGFKWHSFFRCQFADREMVELMKESGCQVVYCGIESGNQQILDNMNKKATVEKYREGLALLNEYGIVSIASLIIGFPGETYETYRDTFNFIEETKPTFFRSHLWYADPESPIYHQKERYQLEGSGYEWAHATMDAQTAAVLSDEMLLKIQNSVYDSDYPVVFDLLNRGLSIEKAKTFINAFDMGLKEKLCNPDVNETNQQWIQQMKDCFSGGRL